jgi:8-oxo-dGTP pyrophosphatase MutT (NUDIX family)
MPVKNNVSKQHKFGNLTNKFSLLSLDSESESYSDSDKSISNTDVDSDSDIDLKAKAKAIPTPKSIVKYVDLSISNKVRCFTCCLCKDSSHVLRKCPNFYDKKNSINRYNYIDNELKSNDKDGFCAGGIIPYYIDPEGNKWILMLIERRSSEYYSDGQEKIGLNFIAGGREGITDPETNITIPENPYQTAINEFKEELGEILTPSSYQLIKTEVEISEPTFIFWSGQSKMALFGVNVSYDLFDKLKLVDNISEKNTEAEDFKWIKVSEYGKYIYKKNTNLTKKHIYYHKFTRQIIYPIIDHLNKI